MTAARYEAWSPRGRTAEVVEALQEICTSYRDAGLPLTVAQAFYRLVAAGAVDCSPSARKRFGVITTRARLAGLLDWDLLVDPTCRLHTATVTATRQSAVQAADERSVADPRALCQPASPARRPGPARTMVEVWTEKDSVAGVVMTVTSKHSASWVACRGLPSLTALQQAARRHAQAMGEGTPVVVLLLADHDDQGRAVERELGRRLHRMSATHWVDAHLDTFGSVALRRGIDLPQVQAAISETLHGQPGLRIQRVALTAEQIRRHHVAANPDGEGHELEAVDPRWLLESLDLAVTGHLRHPTHASSAEETS